MNSLEKVWLIVALSTFKIGPTGPFKSNGLAFVVGETGKQIGDEGPGNRRVIATRQIPIGRGEVVAC